MCVCIPARCCCCDGQRILTTGKPTRFNMLLESSDMFLLEWFYTGKGLRCWNNLAFLFVCKHVHSGCGIRIMQEGCCCCNCQVQTCVFGDNLAWPDVFHHCCIYSDLLRAPFGSTVWYTRHYAGMQPTDECLHKDKLFKIQFSYLFLSYNWVHHVWMTRDTYRERGDQLM